jgi:hypothetical protein
VGSYAAVCVLLAIGPVREARLHVSDDPTDRPTTDPVPAAAPEMAPPDGDDAVPAPDPGLAGDPSAVPRRRPAWVRVCTWTVIVAFAVLGPLAARVGWEGRAELAEADRARDQGDVDREIEHLGRAARWRMPVLGHDEAALDRLVDLGTLAEQRGEDDTQLALAAYREVRRALLATRTWGVPDPDRFAYVNERIAHLMAEQERRFETDVGGTGDPYAYHLGLLNQIPGPDPWPANLAALAFLGWLVASAGFVLRSIDARGRLVPRPAVRWGLASLALLVAWMVALRLAG